MHKVLPLRSWTVLPTVTLLFAASAQSALANQNQGLHRLQNARHFRAHSVSIDTNTNAASSLQNAASNLPKWSSFVSPKGNLRSISQKIDFDLSSTQANITLGTRMFASQDSITIDVGGAQRTLSADSKVTPAEYVAALQSLGGAQSLVLDKDGQGIGGTFTLDSINNAGKSIRASELVVPQGVTGIGNFGHNSDFRVVGNLVNDGNVYALSNNPASSLATISAKNIINESNGVISSAVPTSVSSSYGSILSEVDLRLKADRDITNQGSITSSGSLDLIAGGALTNTFNARATAANNVNITVGSGNVTNGGAIASTNGNINFASSISAQDLNVNNIGGTLQALNGDINFRDPSYTDVGNINFVGGDLYSKQVNLNSGAGTANLAAYDITGLVNVNAACAHVLASTSDLQLGTMNLTGDPTYYNTNGSITINSSINTNGADLALLASGDILLTGGASLNTVSTGVGVNGGSILVVAGANINVPPLIESKNNDTTTLVGFTNSAGPGNGSAVGGKIDFSAGGTVSSTGSISGKANGGNITMVAYAGINAGSGVININNGFTMFSSSLTGGTNGNVTLIAGASSGTTITTGTIQTAATSSGSGNIFISTSTPTINGGGGSISVLNGTIQPGSGSFGVSTFQTGASTALGLLNMKGADLTIESGKGLSSPNLSGTTNSVSFKTNGNLDLANSITAPGGITLEAGGHVRTTSGTLGFSTASATGNAGNIIITAGSFGGANFGDVDFVTNAITLFDTHSSTTNGNGGNVVIVANNFGNNGGRVIFPNAVTIVTGGSGTGSNGNVSINAKSAGDPITAISLGSIDTTGGTAKNTGSITLITPNGGMTVNNLLTTDNANITAVATANIFLPIINGNGSTVLTATAGGVLELNQTTVNQIVASSSNVVGNGILLKGNLTAPGGILLVSSTQIASNDPSHVISTSSSSGDAGNLIMIAGANFTTNPSDISINGASLNGGVIDMSTVPFSGIDTTSSFTNGSGGSVLLVSYNGTNDNGRILLNQSTSISTGGNGSGDNGSVTVISGRNDNGIGIQLGNVNLGGNTAGGGTIELLTTVPNGTKGNPVVISTSTFDTTSGSFFGTNIPANGDIATKFLIAPSGNIFVNSGRQVQLGLLNASAAPAVGAGGSITVITHSSTVLNVSAGGANSIADLSAGGGTTSGNGGSFTIQNIGTGGITLGAFSVPFVTDGTGGSITLDADQGTLNISSGSLIVNGKGTNNDGGFLSLTGKFITPSPLTLAANGIGTGNGGSIFVSQTGNATTIVDSKNFQAFAKGDGGGTVSFTSGGVLSVDMTAIGVAPNGVNGKGGTVFLTGTEVVNALGGTLVINVSAQAGGTGDGGTASVRATKAPATLKVGAGDDYQFIANSGTLGGDGGTGVLISNGNITAEQSGFNVGPLGKNGNGGTMVLNAGFGFPGTGDILVNGNLSALGKGTGDGGTIILQTFSSSIFAIRTDSAPVNGVFGALSTLSKKGNSGTISILSNGSGIAILDPMLNQGTLNLIAAGPITTSASLGGKKTTHFMNITTTSGGFVSANSKAVLTALDAINFNIVGLTGSANAPITFSSSALTMNGSASAFLVNKAKGDMLLNSSTINGNFTLTTAGNIENGNLAPTGFALIDAGGTVTITSTKGGIGTTGSLLTQVTDLSFNTKKGKVDITNSGAGTLNLENSNAGGIINISSSTNIVIAGTVGTSKSTVSLLATGTADIVSLGGVVNGGTVVLTSVGGSIGDLINGAFVTNAPNLQATAGSFIDLLDNASSVTLGSMTANNGNLTVKTAASTKSLTVSENAIINSVNGQLVLQQTNTTKGKLTLDTNSTVQTTGTGGDVYIYIGTLLPAKNNPIGSQANIVVDNKLPTGKVFAGNNGFTAKAPDNILTTIGKDIVFDVGALSFKNLVLNGGVKVTADPPIPAGMIVTMNDLAAPDAVAPVSQSGGTLLTRATHGIAPTISDSASTATTILSKTIELVPTSQTIVSTPDTQIGTSPYATIGSATYSNGSSTTLVTDTLPQPIVGATPCVARSTENSFTLIDADFIAGDDLGIESSNAGTTSIALQNGKTLFAPNVDTTVETPFGKIQIDAKSLVLVVMNNHTLAVYNLDDDHRNAVKLTVGKHATTLSPGRHLVITSRAARDFESINPCESFAYRAIDCTDLQNGLKTFHGQFHVPVAVASVKQLRNLVTSKHPGAKRVAHHLMKTTAILLQLNPNQSDYELKRVPETTAWLN